MMPQSGSPISRAVEPRSATRPTRRATCADAIVVGGGPGGSAAALRLARRGLAVVQLERRQFGAVANDPFRSGEGMLPATLRALERLSAGLPADAWTLAQPTAVSIRWPDGAITLDALPGQQGVRIVDRERFDRQLWDAAVAAGVDGRCGWDVRHLLVERGRIAGVVARGPGDAQVVVRAPLVLDAAGRNAPSLLQFGLRRPERVADFFVVTMFFDDVPDLRDDVAEVHFFDRAAPAIMHGGRLTTGVVRFGLGTYLDVKHGSRLTPEEFFWQRVRTYPELEARLRAGHQVRPVWSRSRLGYQTARIADAGLMLIGDAAGYLNPITGDGILMALRSAELADKVAAVAFARGDFSRRQLHRYELAWRAARRSRSWIGRALIMIHRSPALLNQLGQLAPCRRLLLRALMHS